MNNSTLKVSTRLALGFGVCTVIGIAVAMAGMLQLRSMSTEMAVIANDRLAKIDKAQMVKDNINLTARGIRNMALAADPKMRDAEAQRIAAARAEVTKGLEELDKAVNQPRARELLQALLERRKAFSEQLDKGLALLQGGADSAKMVAFLTGEMRGVQAAYFKACDEFQDYQMKQAVESAHDAERAAASQSALMLGLAVLAGLVGCVAGWMLTRSLNRALGAEPDQVCAAVQRVADGDLASPVSVRPGDSASIMAAVSRMQQRLGDVVRSVRQNAESVATASAQIAQGNQDLSQRTEEQASALQQTSATMTELSSTVRSNSESARQANQMALSASSTADQGGEVVGRVVHTMKGINDSSRKIADIITVIDGIAFQTNILALNAAVEAARAGEQGRGFAVVAGEVRNLAQRSADAAKEIKSLITASVERVERGGALADEAGSTMDEIVDAIGRVTTLMSEITSATVEQSSGIQQVGDAISQLDQVTQQNAALVEESAAAAESLKQQAGGLVHAVGVFRLPA